MEEFIAGHADLFNEDEIEERRSCVFDLQVCATDAGLIDGWPTFRDDLYEDPVTTLHCLGLAIHQVLIGKFLEKVRELG